MTEDTTVTKVENKVKVNLPFQESGQSRDKAAEDTGYDPIAIARRNPQSKKKAITAFCCQCMGGLVPGWKGDIRGCTAPNCPLYPHRPYQAIRSDIVAI